MCIYNLKKKCVQASLYVVCKRLKILLYSEKYTEKIIFRLGWYQIKGGWREI